MDVFMNFAGLIIVRELDDYAGTYFLSLLTPNIDELELNITGLNTFCGCYTYLAIFNFHARLHSNIFILMQFLFILLLVNIPDLAIWTFS